MRELLPGFQRPGRRERQSRHVGVEGGSVSSRPHGPWLLVSLVVSFDIFRCSWSAMTAADEYGMEEEAGSAAVKRAALRSGGVTQLAG